jgi:hypothetical protein
MDCKSETAGNRQAKYVSIDQEADKLGREIYALEGLIDELSGSAPPLNKAMVEGKAPTPPFQSVYDSLAERISKYSSRIEEATRKIRELLL